MKAQKWTDEVIEAKAIEEILTWDYEATGDVAPWDYDDNIIMGSGLEDAKAFLIECDWKIPAKDDPKGFAKEFASWYAANCE